MVSINDLYIMFVDHEKEILNGQKAMNWNDTHKTTITTHNSNAFHIDKHCNIDKWLTFQTPKFPKP